MGKACQHLTVAQSLFREFRRTVEALCFRWSTVLDCVGIIVLTYLVIIACCVFFLRICLLSTVK